MYRFRLRYLNSQGTLMRILMTVSRRGLDLSYVQAEPSGDAYQATLLVEAPVKQMLQMCRDWRVIVDMLEVEPPVEVRNLDEALAGLATLQPAGSGHAAVVN